jgi:Radical SAM superfamily/Iron-sulfur cluster-binding domain
VVDDLLQEADAHIGRNEPMHAEMLLKRCYDIAPDSREVQRKLFDTYQKNLVVLKQSRYMDFPLFVSLETQTVCNARCSFCPYPGLERLGNKMPDELIDKVISDLEAIPEDVQFRFAPFKVSDPFTDARLFGIIETINLRLPNALIDLYSNGASLTATRLESLRHIRNFQYLNISLNEHRKEVYEPLMGLKFEHTLARLTHLHERMIKGELPFSVVVSKVCDYQYDEEFRAWVTEHFPGFAVHTHRRSDWLGQVDVTGHSVPDIGCAMWFGLSITSTGLVSYCCMDGTGDHPIGDVSKQHALDVYNTPAFREVREKHMSRIGGSPCGQCTFF